MINDPYIFTIAYNCGFILDKCLESFFKHHSDIVHVFGMPNDFKPLKKYAGKVEFIELSSDQTLKEHYKHGHLGTAYIWAGVLSGKYTDCRHVIQFDSDVIFLEECVSDIERGFDDGYDLIGPRRAYEKNPCNRNDLKGLRDVVSTYFMGVNRSRVGKYDFETLHRMVVGYYNPLGHPILDFFDPVSFDILKNGGKALYLNFYDYGSMDEGGSKENGTGGLNSAMDFGRKIAHFAGVGSGMNFFNNGNGSVPDTYAEWAKERYAVYMKAVRGSDIGHKYDESTYKLIVQHMPKNSKIE